ncbi:MULTISPECIES: polysaccharide pyruvyl transferase family protein [Psychrilyobacter]|uniref:Polysaccharide pyruvyl transferase family protein n=1 Tax=Psychrilyobacter piezotolerans TaxID=2293438 RepID=A0ABX9KI12_9FUSO|nr:MULTISPECIES: polysaccharide pyruvyl transferase family protein [Psychrilyobacter]MCS5420921.1 polysaccharide pyruvyl transferase family protein [Psychrilyobacter sp. S5]NDI77675.1 polysaccharide pyruvyl transferase family protein [Psychrilyobacter piezotolerans]RDE62681.1 polysaccharide pyruvyl transferase family protein [Psychrilyobacter sp. S5]REI41611.1 polysaccharide pyruvyl transferase family protein [Psychrilyobacter piezotolerans]
MKMISVLDTSVCTRNVGDEIIMECVKSQLRDIFPRTMFLKVPTHERVTKISSIKMRETEIGFVGGTNLLAFNMCYPINQWNIHLWNIKNFSNNDIVLMGVGSQNYGDKINWYTKLLYKKVLTPKYLHSVRDSYTENMLKKMGINNVINTGCPTLWSLTEKHCENIPTRKSKNVICTFTDYRKDIDKDKELAEILFKNYENVYCWIQGSNDFDYIKSISDKFILVDPHLEEYDRILESDIDLDYVGTRLHAGIRAMQKGRRTIILSIDNRAREMGKDYNMNVLDRTDIDKLEKYIHSEFKTNIKLNIDNINMWKNQFNKKE